MKISYGIDVKESDDSYISLAEHALNGLNEAAIPGTFWVDLFPILKYVPSRFPGAGFRKKATMERTIMIEKLFRYVEKQLVGDQFFFFFWRAHEIVHTNIFAEKRQSCTIGGSIPHRASS